MMEIVFLIKIKILGSWPCRLLAEANLQTVINEKL